MIEFKNTHLLPEEVQKIFLPFLKKFIVPIEREVHSVFVYGSATGKNFIAKNSDINFAIVAEQISFPFLQKSLQAMNAWHDRRIHAPLFLTQSHINSSLDVFPIEFLEMKNNYVLLCGKDFLQDITIDAQHVRLFCEQQLKGKIIRIHQAYVESGNRASTIETLLKDSLNTLIPVFRSLLWIKQVDAPSDKGLVLSKVAEVFNAPISSMIMIWKDKKNDERILGRDVHEVFAQYIQELEHLAQVIDQL